jgi:hypothetical protein
MAAAVSGHVNAAARNRSAGGFALLGTVARVMLFAFRYRAEIGAYLEKHGEPIRQAIADARPLIDAYVGEGQPGSDGIVDAMKIARKVSDPASPMPGDPWGPTNPNPNAG